MLKALRGGGVAQIAMGAIVVAIIIVFVMPTMGTGSGTLKVDCAVTVKEECVSLKDYFANIGLLNNGQLTSKQVKAINLPKVVLDGLVERELLAKEAERLGLAVSDDAITKELTEGRFHVSVPAGALDDSYVFRKRPTPLAYILGMSPDMVRHVPVFNTKTQKFDSDRYKRIVKNLARRSPAEFREQQGREILANRMRTLVRSRVRVSPEEAWLSYERSESEAQIRSVSVRKVWFERYVVNLDKKAVSEWAKTHQAEIDTGWARTKGDWSQDCLLFSEIRVDFPPAANDDDKATKRPGIEEAKRLLGEKNSFERVARQLSDAPTAHLGGATGCLTEKYGKGHEALTKALGAMTKGKVSDVIETERGFHIVRFEGKLNAAEVEARGRSHVALDLAVKAATDELVKQFAQALLKAAKDGEKLVEATDRLAKEYASRGLDLKDDEDPPGLEDNDRPKLQVSGTFNRGAPLPPIPGALEDVAAAAFLLPKADAMHPTLIRLGDGFAVMQLKDKTVASREDFEKEKAEYLTNLRAAKELEALAHYVKGLRDAAGDISYNQELISGKKKDSDSESGDSDS